ncbi:DHS-like NAD protein [Venustampulla echinocandica]|uniref:DHS-like NAD protein n=1 Tax=Venustampulla echinocandica TaxID=2656787 RepID=A0A370U2D1_9HELO|nr:DHS-like NAD protein [Venustampulla echinocandica]RDL41940.1 DHS-like NAD protein [Venustampulla echinocandica]
MDSSSSLPSSPLSSIGSRSPSPPANYPSPPSSHDSDVRPLSQAHNGAADGDAPPPAKKRKISPPKELKTEYLDLRALNASLDKDHHKAQDAKLKKLTDVLRTKRKIVVIAGAGISVSAGIPDFRSSTGLFSTLRSQHKLKSSGKHLFDASVYGDDSSTSSFHDMVRELSLLTQTAEPTPFHHMLATLAEEGRLMRLYTQNVDGIETSLTPLATHVPLNSKGPWPKTIQLHGGLEKMTCSKCHKLSEFDGSLFQGPEPPSCTECESTDSVRVAAGLRSHGIGRLRPRLLLYNEYNPDEEAIGAASHADLKSRPDAVIVVGTSLKVPGVRRLAREMCAVTRGRRGGFAAWINIDPEPLGVDFKNGWDMVVRGECDDVARCVGLPRWDDRDIGEYRFIEDEMKGTNPLVGVVVPSTPTTAIKTQGILTPSDTPRQQSPSVLANKSKMKQPQLPFGSSQPLQLKKNGQPKKKPGRKPLPSSKPTNTITHTFTATKTSKAAATKDKKPAVLDLFPGLAVAPTPPMREVSPLDVRTNGDTKSRYISVEIPAYNHEATISPKGSVPSGMELFFS